MISKKPDAVVRRASRISRTTLPTIKLEKAAWDSGYRVVAGVDEVGRGAWAGPLVAAAVVLPPEPQLRRRLTRMLNRKSVVPRDSKLLTADARDRIFSVIQEAGLQFAVAEISPDVIDIIGVGTANQKALCAAVESLVGVQFALVDHFSPDDMTCDYRAIPTGDRVCLSIALASVVAKVHRDRVMAEIDRTHPDYGFGVHKGYGTRVHAHALECHGVTVHHRRSFRPVAEHLVSV